MDEKYAATMLDLIRMQGCYSELEEKYGDISNEFDALELLHKQKGKLLDKKDEVIEQRDATIKRLYKENDDLKYDLNILRNIAEPDIETLKEILDVPNQKMGEDTGEEPSYDYLPSSEYASDKLAQTQPAKKAKAESGRVLPIWHKPRAYHSKRNFVTDERVIAALDYMRDNEATYVRIPGEGIDRDGVRYAHYYGKLDKFGNVGFLKTIILSSELKVYQCEEHEDHVELRWQNNRTLKGKRPYGNICLIGEGKGYECSIKPVFTSELGIDI